MRLKNSTNVLGESRDSLSAPWVPFSAFLFSTSRRHAPWNHIVVSSW